MSFKILYWFLCGIKYGQKLKGKWAEWKWEYVNYAEQEECYSHAFPSLKPSGGGKDYRKISGY